MTTMDIIQELNDCYQQYLALTCTLQAESNPTDGLFGFGNDPKNHPGHEAFYQKVGLLIQEFLSSSPTSEQAEAVAHLLVCTAAQQRSNRLAYWFLYAAQGHVRPVLPLLTPSAAATLVEFYNRHYPRVDRYPVQKEVFRLLKRRSC